MSRESAFLSPLRRGLHSALRPHARRVRLCWVKREEDPAAGKIADSYYNSANVAELWTVTSSNGNGKVTFENFSTFTMNTPVPPKNIIPREPTFWEGAWDTVKTLGPWAFFGYALGGGGLANHTSTTVNNAAAAP